MQTASNLDKLQVNVHIVIISKFWILYTTYNLQHL